MHTHVKLEMEGRENWSMEFSNKGSLEWNGKGRKGKKRREASRFGVFNLGIAVLGKRGPIYVCIYLIVQKMILISWSFTSGCRN